MAEGETFESFIEKERARLRKKRESAETRRGELDKEIAEIDRELEAIDAYEQVKQGKVATGRRKASGPRGEKRKRLLELMKSKPDLTRGEILEKMGVKGDKSGEQSVSNALSALKKQGAIIAVDGKYHVV